MCLIRHVRTRIFSRFLPSFKPAFTCCGGGVATIGLGWLGILPGPVTVSAGVNASNSPKLLRWLMRLELHRAGVLLQPYVVNGLFVAAARYHAPVRGLRY